MKASTIFLGGAIFLILIGRTVPVQAGIKRAVIVGIADYKKINDLSYTGNDASHIYRRCLWYGVNKSKVKLLKNKKATRDTIRNECKNMAESIKPGQTCLFFFSGHGTYGPDVSPFDETDGLDEYLCAYNASDSSLKNHIRDDQLEKWLSPAVNKGANVVVILDTCFSGGAIKREVKIPGTARSEELLVKTMEGKPEVGITDGFAKDLDYSGFWVMTACDDDEISYEWPWFQMGVLTFFADLALSGQADDSYLLGGIGNDDGVITYHEVRAALGALDGMAYSMFGDLQTPQFYFGPEDIDLFDMRY